MLKNFTLIIFIFIISCKNSKSKNENQNFFAIILLRTNQTSKSCDVYPLENILNLKKKSIYNFDTCINPKNYLFYKRTFNPNISSQIAKVEINSFINLEFENRKLNLPFSYSIFGTKESTLFDEIAFKKNPKIYDYTEYHTIINFDSNTINGFSEISIQDSFDQAIKKCKEGNSL